METVKKIVSRVGIFFGGYLLGSLLGMLALVVILALFSNFESDTALAVAGVAAQCIGLTTGSYFVVNAIRKERCEQSDLKPVPKLFDKNLVVISVIGAFPGILLGIFLAYASIVTSESVSPRGLFFISGGIAVGGVLLAQFLYKRKPRN